MIQDRRVSLTALLAGLLWIAAGATVAASVVLDVPRVAPVGLFVAVVAMTVTVRYWLTLQRDQVRSAFELGCDTGREDTSLRTVR